MSEEKFNHYEEQPIQRDEYGQVLSEDKSYDKYSIVAFICSLLGLKLYSYIFGPLAIVISTIALKRLKNAPQLKGKTFSIISLILGIVETLLGIIGIIAIIYFMKNGNLTFD